MHRCTSACLAGTHLAWGETVALATPTWCFHDGIGSLRSWSCAQNPAAAVRQLVTGTFLFHLSFVILRKQEQLRRLTTHERFPCATQNLYLSSARRNGAVARALFDRPHAARPPVPILLHPWRRCRPQIR